MTSRGISNATGWGLTVLVAVMPLHAILVLSLGNLFGHESLWASWKEILLVVMAAASAYLVVVEPKLRNRLKQPFVYAILVFGVIAAVVTTAARPPLANAAIGAKTDFEFLVAALIAVVVSSPALIKRLTKVFLASTAIVIIFGLLQATVLPHDVLNSLGYGTGPGQTAAFETILIGGRTAFRFSSTLGGPNQLGTFLILPLCLSLLLSLKQRRWWLYSLAIIPVLFISYSRGAWIGAVVAALVVGVIATPVRRRMAVGIAVGALSLVIGLFAWFGPSTGPLASYLHHSSATGTKSSDSQHALSLKTGVNNLLMHPLGHGLGTAGPATFHAGTINIIEDNYLQIGYEAGVLGLLAFIGVIIFAVIQLSKDASDVPALATLAALVGISLTAIVLPAWTDSSTALTVWTFAGVSLGAKYV